MIGLCFNDWFNHDHIPENQHRDIFDALLETIHLSSPSFNYITGHTLDYFSHFLDRNLFDISKFYRCLIMMTFQNKPKEGIKFKKIINELKVKILYKFCLTKRDGKLQYDNMDCFQRHSEYFIRQYFTHDHSITINIFTRKITFDYVDQEPSINLLTELTSMINLFKPDASLVYEEPQSLKDLASLGNKV